VRNTQWNKIDENWLGMTSTEKMVRAEMMENGWMRMRMAKDSNHISVPFPRGSKALGPKDFLVGDLYPRSFVSVITGEACEFTRRRGFHYDLLSSSRPPGTEDDYQVHGEM